MGHTFRLQYHVIIQEEQKLTGSDLYRSLALTDCIRGVDNFSPYIQP